MFQKISILGLCSSLLFLVSCSKKETSRATGWKYNDEKWGGFEKVEYGGQATGPNLVLIEGGSFVMGMTEEDVMYRWNAIPRKVTVQSFYMDETEVSNVDYRMFVEWNKRVYGESSPERIKDILPDTLVWREELAANEPMVENYFRHPAYDDYPVVGVTWEQANEFSLWRTDRVNEMLLIKKGYFNPNPDQKGADNFNTKAYLAGQYQGNVDKMKKDKSTGQERRIKYTDGILLPSYRLPTEAEWEYAALALQGNMKSDQDAIITDRKIFPWNGSSARYSRENKYKGRFLANFKLSGGDYMGIAGNLNDNAAIPERVDMYHPNDFGLYNMAGNVSEWTADVYRPLTSMDLSDVDNNELNPFRGNVFTTDVRDEEGRLVEKDSLGRIRQRGLTEEELAIRENIFVADARSYRDGDEDSGAEYIYGENSLISDKSRVIKGGSWADRLYWLSPGARRFMDQDRGSKSVGFRCAMTRVGSSSGNASNGGNQFKVQSKKSKKNRFK